MSWAEYGACPVTVGVDGPAPARPANVPEGAWVANAADAPDGVMVDGGEWANPFKVGRDGSRAEVNRKYEAWLIANPDLMARLPELAGKTLTAKAYPLPSHAETLSKWANDPSSIPIAAATEAPIPKPSGPPARVWRPADDEPVRVMVTGSRKWADTDRMDEALSWAVRNARTAYPGRRIELVHGGATGADSMAGAWWEKQGLGPVDVHPVTSKMWDREGKGAGHARNARMVTTRPHVVLAFDKDGSPGTASAIRLAREAGLPVYAFHDTHGIQSHTAYPGRNNPDAVELTDATEPDYGMYERDMEELGYHNPTIPFRGINAELARQYNSRVFIPGERDATGVMQPGREVYLKQAVPERRAPIKDPEGYETWLADTAYAAEPDWAFWGQSRPQMSKYDHRRDPYSDDELQMAGAIWGEEMDDFITTLTHRAQTRNNTMWSYDVLASHDSPMVREKAESLGKEIDTFIRDRRLLERGVTPEVDTPTPQAKPRTPQKIDEIQLRRDAATQFEQDNGRPPRAADPADIEMLEGIKAKLRGNDVAVRTMTPTEQARYTAQKWEKWAQRYVGGPRVPRTKRWPGLSDAERRREIRAAEYRGVILDPETGAQIGTGPKAGQSRLVEQEVTQDGVTGTTLVKEADPNERIVTDAPPERWKDPLDSDRTLSTDEELDVLARDQFEIENGAPPMADDMAEVEFIKQQLKDQQKEALTATPEPMLDREARRKQYAGGVEPSTSPLAAAVERTNVEQSRGISMETAQQPRYEDSGELTPTITGAANVKDRAPKQVSMGAQQLIQTAIDNWPKGYEKPKVRYPDRPGLDAYTAADAAKLRAVIYLIVERTGGIAGSPTAKRNARQAARIKQIVDNG